MSAKEERLIELSNTKSIALKISISGIMSAVTCVVTIIVSISIPASQGFFNIGESMVYLSAILFGPYIGAISGGIGSMMADLILGYPGYAIGTLIIKGLEGFIVGYLYQLMSKKERSKKLYAFIFVCSMILLGLILILIFNPRELPILDALQFLFEIIIAGDSFVWLMVSLSSLITVILISVILRLFVDKDTSNKMLSMLSGGIVMVIGYFLYATLVMGIAGAYIEMPFNVLQSIIGILIAVPISIPIKKQLRI